MIHLINNIISDLECDEFIEYYKSNQNKIVKNENDNVYHFNAIDILNDINGFLFTKRFFKKSNIDRLRIQHLDNTINFVESPHGHYLPFSLVIFLNDGFNGGELVFDNITIIPKKGQIVYFTGDELHYVKPVLNGDRYTLVSFLTSDLGISKTNLL